MATLSTLSTPIATKLINDDGTINHVWNEFFVRLMVNAGLTVQLDALEVTTQGLQVQVDAVGTELAASATITDSDESGTEVTSILYDGYKATGGVIYSLAGTDKYIQYAYSMINYFDRIGIWCDSAGGSLGRAYIALSDDAETWTYYSAEGDHTLTSEGRLVSQGTGSTGLLDAQTDYWELAAGTNIAIFPNNTSAKYVRIWLLGTYDITIYEIIPSRMVLAELGVIENLAAISATFGPMAGYANFDSKFAELDDKLSDIENGATRNAYRSDWDDETAYVVGDLVIDDDNGWICILAHTGHAPPTYPVTSNDWWSIYTVKGADGVAGAAGADGLSSYVHYAYATAADGSTGFTTTYTGSETYSGWLVDNTEADSEDYTDYAWSLFAGSDGADGADGTDGADGDPGPAVVITSSRAVTFTSTDDVLTTGQSDIVFTATVYGIDSPTYSWSQTGCQSTPASATNGSTYTVTAAEFGTSKSAIITCTVDSTYTNSTTIVRIEASTFNTDDSYLENGYTTIVGDVISVFGTTITIVEDENDMIDWIEDSTTYEAQLTASTSYTPTTLAAHVQSVMRAEGDSNTTVSYGSVSKTITIANSTLTTFELLWESGDNTEVTCGRALGFDITADDDGALTYEADRPAALRVLMGDLS